LAQQLDRIAELCEELSDLDCVEQELQASLLEEAAEEISID